MIDGSLVPSLVDSFDISLAKVPVRSITTKGYSSAKLHTFQINREAYAI